MNLTTVFIAVDVVDLEPLGRVFSVLHVTAANRRHVNRSSQFSSKGREVIESNTLSLKLVSSKASMACNRFGLFSTAEVW